VRGIQKQVQEQVQGQGQWQTRGPLAMGPSIRDYDMSGIKRLDLEFMGRWPLGRFPESGVTEFVQ
jgi:hypothetical protein